MSTLIPQKRPDKNGKLVTRHVKADGSPSAGNTLIPAPQLAPASRVEESADASQRSDAELVHAIGSNFSKAGFALTYDHLELIEGTKVVSPRRSLLEALSEATEGIDGYGANSLMKTFRKYSHKKHLRDTAHLELSARAYKFSRMVDDATPDSTELFLYHGQIGMFSQQFFSDSTTSGSDPDDVTELEGAYLLERLSLNDPDKFNSNGAYYRGLHQIKERRDELEPYLPLLIAARMVDETSNSSLADIFSLSGELAKVCPAEKAKSIAQVVVDRRVFSVDMVKALAESDAPSLSSGVL